MLNTRFLVIAPLLLALAAIGCDSDRASSDTLGDVEVADGGDLDSDSELGPDLPDSGEQCGGKACCDATWVDGSPGSGALHQWLLPSALFAVRGVSPASGEQQFTGTISSVGVAAEGVTQPCRGSYFQHVGPPCSGDTLVEVDTGGAVISVVAALDADISAWNDGRSVTLTVVGGEFAGPQPHTVTLSDADGPLLVMVAPQDLQPGSPWSYGPLSVAPQTLECVAPRDSCGRLIGVRGLQVTAGDATVSVGATETSTITSGGLSWEVTHRYHIERQYGLETGGTVCADLTSSRISFEILRTN